MVIFVKTNFASRNYEPYDKQKPLKQWNVFFWKTSIANKTKTGSQISIHLVNNNGDGYVNDDEGDYWYECESEDSEGENSELDDS